MTVSQCTVVSSTLKFLSLCCFPHPDTALTAGFVQTDVQVLETDGFTSARVRAFVNGRITQPVTLQISIQPGGTATGVSSQSSTSTLLPAN